MSDIFKVQICNRFLSAAFFFSCHYYYFFHWGMPINYVIKWSSHLICLKLHVIIFLELKRCLFYCSEAIIQNLWGLILLHPFLSLLFLECKCSHSFNRDKVYICKSILKRIGRQKFDDLHLHFLKKKSYYLRIWVSHLHICLFPRHIHIDTKFYI